MPGWSMKKSRILYRLTLKSKLKLMARNRYKTKMM